MKPVDLAIPILPSRSLAETLKFYGRLGFAGKLCGVGDSYAILTRGCVELHFFHHPTLQPAKCYGGCYIRVGDVDAVYAAFLTAELPRQGLPRMDFLEDKPWGMREFAVVDLDGNLIRIGRVLG